jgi:hypothetical protein
LQANLSERNADLGRGERVGDTSAGHSEGLRERAHTDHARVGEGFRIGDEIARRHEVGISFVQDNDDVRRQRTEKRSKRVARCKGAARIIGIGEIDDARARLVRAFGKPPELYGAIREVRHRFEASAVSDRVIHVGRVTTERHDRHVARPKIRTDRKPEQIVDAGCDRDVRRAASVTRGERFAEFDRFRIAVPTRMRECRTHRIERFRRRPERTLVRTEPHERIQARAPREFLGPDEGSTLG